MGSENAEFAKWLTTLGIGGVLAGFMFVFYRKDIKLYAELFKITTEQLITLTKENVGAVTRLITMIESQERNAMRKNDIEFMRRKEDKQPEDK